MKFTGYRKVHIVMPGLEIVRVVKPLRFIGCEKLILIGDPDKNNPNTKVYYEYNEEIKRQLKGALGPKDIINIDVDINDIESLLSVLCRAIREERDARNIVFVNVSCGSKVFVAAATMAAMMYGGIPYFSKRIGFRTKLKDLEEDGHPAGIAKDAGDPSQLPTFDLRPPEPELIHVLSIIAAFKDRTVRQGDIIKELARLGVMKDVYEEEKPTPKRKTIMGNKRISRKALGDFKTMFFNRLLANGWVNTNGSGRGVEVLLTEKGVQMEKIFSGVYKDNE
jgi:hypothetical protein